MENSSSDISGLTPEGCEIRRRRLATVLGEQSLDACLLADRRHVYYLSGYWSASFHTPLILLRSDGSYHLVLPDAAEDTFSLGETSYYPSHRMCTLVADQIGAATSLLERELQEIDQLGFDVAPPIFGEFKNSADISAQLFKLRRAKLPDEVELLRHAIRGCQAAYAHARSMMQPGIREIDIYAEMQAAAVKEIGEPIGEVGNDFQSGSPGGPPRKRRIEQGELMPLDVSVSVRGYRCDLCRTIAVGGTPSPEQQGAAQRAVEALDYVEQHAVLGAHCGELCEAVKLQLEKDSPWQFFHHLGHGTGLSPHEPPYLNPEWDDRFQAGDLFTVEPGLYHEDLRAGVRIEQNYWFSSTGLQRLSSYPTDL